MGKRPEPVEITPEIIRDIEKTLKCSRRERERLIRILRYYKVPVTKYVENILAEMDKYLSEWYCVVWLEVTETYIIEEEETASDCVNCRPVREKKKKGRKNPKTLTPAPVFQSHLPPSTNQGQSSIEIYIF